MYKIIDIKTLSINDAGILSDLLLSSDKNYSKHFIPFPFDLNTIKKTLTTLVEDKFFGVFVDNELVGFYMLRGFDEGFEIPSYGVWISENYSGLGLSKLTLQHAISFCKINRIKKIMLKVHPENVIAKNIYENFGFTQEAIDKKNSNLIYYKLLD
jgi:RimJ/RimL family protein N-acetyltransferase